MRKIVSLIPLCLVCGFVHADVLPLDVALQNTYRACVDIDQDLHDLKVLAGINTAVTGVGTGLGIGAVATGISKVSVDKDAEQLEQELQEEIRKLEELAKTQTKIDYIPSYAEMMQQAEKLSESKPETDDADVAKQKDIIEQKTEELKKTTEKSKKLGSWRTGLLAGNTATSVAGAIIAHKSKVDDDLQSKIDVCNTAVKDLNNSIIQAKINNEDVSEAQSIYQACRDYEFVDVTPINNRAKGSMIASAVGAVTGGAGTVTSSIANSDKIRDDNTDAGKKKEKNLNTASNVLAVGATAASATATVFNATQIAAIKKVATVSEKCTGVLK